MNARCLASGTVIYRPFGQSGLFAQGASAYSPPTPRCEAPKSIPEQPPAQGKWGAGDSSTNLHWLPGCSVALRATPVCSLFRHSLLHLFTSSAPAMPTQRPAHIDYTPNPAPRCAVRRCTDSTPAVGQPLHSLRVAYGLGQGQVG